MLRNSFVRQMNMRSLVRCFIGAALALGPAPPVAGPGLAREADSPHRQFRRRRQHRRHRPLDGHETQRSPRAAGGGRKPCRRERATSALVRWRRAAPDGYTLLHSSDGPILINPHIFKMDGRTWRKSWCRLRRPLGLRCSWLRVQAYPRATSAEFVAHARANPGKLNYGSAGRWHAATCRHRNDHGRGQVRGRARAVQGLAGSARGPACRSGGFTIDLGAAIPHIQSGKVRLLAVPGKMRSPIFPETPTLVESGVNVNLTWISGVYAPAGTPAPIVTRLNKEITRIMHRPDTKKQLDAMAAEVVPAMTPEEFAAHQQRARDSFGADRAQCRHQGELKLSVSAV